MSNVVTMYVYKAHRSGDFSVTEKYAARMRGYCEWKRLVWTGVRESDRKRATSPAVLRLVRAPE